MNPLAPPESATQQRVLGLFERLGYQSLGNWTDRPGNSNIEDALLSAWLEGRGYSAAHISKTLDALHREADNTTRSLYDNNKAVYSLLRYGVPVKVDTHSNTDTVRLVDWDTPENNTFAVAEATTSAAPTSCCM